MTAATRWFSLRRRLLVWLLGGVTSGWLVAVGYVFVEVRHEVMELLEKHDRHGELERHVQKELAEHFAEALLAPLLFGVPLLGAWLWFAAWHGLAPLDRIALEVAAREPERLDPLAPDAAPRELRPLLDAMNTLFGRVAGTLDKERRFTADAAHELRTPLAAILAQAQVAQRARDAAERDHALAQIVASGQRAGRLVDQLLQLARLDAADALPRTTLRLDQLAAEVCAEHGAAALEKQITLTLDAAVPVIVPGHADMLRVLLRNLLDNALRYTPVGGHVSVKVGGSAQTAELVVSDDGPGIPAGQREKVLDRFYRLADQDTNGSGLGLSIVARIAALHDARLELADGIGTPGLTVRLQLPQS